jgi:hypothetical protein
MLLSHVCLLRKHVLSAWVSGQGLPGFAAISAGKGDAAIALTSAAYSKSLWLLTSALGNDARGQNLCMMSQTPAQSCDAPGPDSSFSHC